MKTKKQRKKIEIEGIFDIIENAITLFYMEKGLRKITDIPFNTFELSLFIEEYLKNPRLDSEEIMKNLRNNLKQK
ncbi:MAG: hypothetical protein ACOC3Z_02130 [Nanoarchaeota archaeon]